MLSTKKTDSISPLGTYYRFKKSESIFKLMLSEKGKESEYSYANFKLYLMQIYPKEHNTIIAEIEKVTKKTNLSKSEIKYILSQALILKISEDFKTNAKIRQVIFPFLAIK